MAQSAYSATEKKNILARRKSTDNPQQNTSKHQKKIARWIDTATRQLVNYT